MTGTSFDWKDLLFIPKPLPHKISAPVHKNNIFTNYLLKYGNASVNKHPEQFNIFRNFYFIN